LAAGRITRFRESAVVIMLGNFPHRKVIFNRF